MDHKKLRRYWSLSLLMNALSAGTIAFFNMIEIEIPVFLTRFLGIMTFFALPILVYTTIRLYIMKKQ